MMRPAACGFLVLLACASAAADDYAAAVESWTVVLDKFVDAQGRVAFTALAQDRAELDEFVAYIARVSPASTPEQFATPARTLAYHINAYNALAMHGVIEAGIPAGFDGFFKRAGFFKFRKVMIGGEKTSLYDYENKVIRPLDEPRVHFALNCMVRDCPRLPQRPFTAAELESQLQAVTREFFSKDKHLRIDADKSVVWVSEILDFYTKDFIGSNKSQKLIGYINQYRIAPVPDGYKLRFIPYDWTINQQ